MVSLKAADSSLPPENSHEDTDGLLLEGGEAARQRPFDAAACSSRSLLMCFSSGDVITSEGRSNGC